jgi:hypothetical protein
MALRGRKNRELILVPFHVTLSYSVMHHMYFVDRGDQVGPARTVSGTS